MIIARSAENLATCCLSHTHLEYQWTIPARTTSTFRMNCYQKGTKWYWSWLKRWELNLTALPTAKVTQVVMEMGMDKATFLSNFRKSFLVNGVRIRNFHRNWARFICVEQCCSLLCVRKLDFDHGTLISSHASRSIRFDVWMLVRCAFIVVLHQQLVSVVSYKSSALSWTW